jgi:thymidine kinase
VFQTCEQDFKRSLAKESQNLQEKARKYAEKQSIIEYISKEPAQPSGAECLSTQEELSFFDSTQIVTVPKVYDGLKLPNSSKID